MALLDRDSAGVGAELTVHVVGVERGARVIARSPYDPTGARMRS
jgi:dimethylglycine dehydrogenase